MPKTKLGLWSVYLILAFFVLYAAFTAITLLIGPEDPNAIFERLSLVVVAAVACSTASLITGLIALAKNKERSPLVFVSSLFGLVILVYIIDNLT